MARGIGIWPQLVSGSSVKRTALTRKSLTIWSTGNREKRNYCKFMTRGRLRVVVNGRVLEPNSELWRDAAGPEPPWVSFSSSWTLWILAGRQFSEARHRESRLEVLPSHSHTHLDGKCVLAMWQELVKEIRSTAGGEEKTLPDTCKKRTSARTLNEKQQIIIINFYSEVLHLICTWINTSSLPTQDYKHCSFFSFWSEQHQFLYKFSHDWFWRIEFHRSVIY